MLRRTYDLDYRLTAQSIAGTSNTYASDAIGNITKIQSNSLGEMNYSYDALDRLTEEANTTQKQTYIYDAVGNRTKKVLSLLIDDNVNDSAVTTFEYAASNNRLTKVGEHLMLNDEVGNLIKTPSNHKLTYDEQNRLSTVENDGAILAQFHYNFLGQRTQKVTPQGVTTFLYGLDGELLGETLFNAQGLKISSQFYVWLEELPVGGISVNYDVTGAPSKTAQFYLYSDHINAPRIATNAARETVWKWESDAFGVGKTSGPLTLNLRFPGQYYDAETDLHYNYYRSYDPRSGRYIESDPTGIKGGINTYLYASGNPMKYVDPLGLESIFGWSAKAEAEAKNSELPGEHNGPQDAYRHCVASCMIASSNWGESASRFAGWAHEASNFGQSRSERAMDDWNNQAGICAAKGDKSPELCPKSCMTSLENGVLRTGANSNGAYY
jgi:RHS repeat-associated protein